MKRTLAIAALLASGLSLSAVAQSTATAPASKIAVIAFQTAVAQTNEFQRNYAGIQKKYEPKRNELKSQDDQIASLTKQLEAQSATLSEAQRATRTATIAAKKKDLQRDAEDAQGNFQQDVQDAFKGVAAKVYPVMVSYAKEHGYTLIIDGSGQQSPILYTTESSDITKPVIEAYNKKSGVPAPASSNAAPDAHSTHPAAHPSQEK